MVPKRWRFFLCDYDFVGMMTINSKLEERPKSRLEVVASHSAVTESNTMAESEACGDCLSALQLSCTPGHRLCSMNGVHFVICVTQAFPVERLGLARKLYPNRPGVPYKGYLSSYIAHAYCS